MGNEKLNVPKPPLLQSNKTPENGSTVMPPLPEIKTNGGKTNKPLLWWFVNLLTPGAGFYYNNPRLSLKIIATLSTLLWVSLIAGFAYLYFTSDIQDLGLTFISNTTYLQYVLYGIIAAGTLWILLMVTATGRILHLANWKKWQKVSLTLVSSLTAITVGLASFWGAYNIHSLQTALTAITQADNIEFTFSGATPLEKIDNEEKIWGTEQRVNILILGSDAGPGRWGARPDIIMVASINTITGSTQLFNLPRNLQNARFPAGTPGAAAYPNGYPGLINAVWTWAEGRPSLYPDSSRPGLTATKDIVSETLGLPIEYYMVVNMQGFVDLINVLGGIRVDIPRALPIGNSGQYLQPGADQLIGGKRALWFARSRSDSSDYDRMLRQRCVISAVVDRFDGETIATKLPEIFSVLGSNLTTNISQEDIKDWVELFDLVRENTIQGYAFVGGVISPSRPDLTFIRNKVQELIKDPVISIYNQRGAGSFGILEASVPQEEKAPVQQANPYC